MTIIRNDDDIQAALGELVLIDPRLAAIVETAGPVPLRLSEPGFAGLASIIVSQMVSRASADAIWRRISAGGPVTAEAYAALDPELIATFGLSRAKARTLANLAAVIAEGRFDLENLNTLDAADAVRLLTDLPGIGPWTAEVYLMFCGGHADMFPVGDVALQAAVADAFSLPARPAGKVLAEMARVWRPWRSVAARLFWAYYAVRMRRNVTPLV
jgi:DNA-3-methyladenine glycosylase II